MHSSKRQLLQLVQICNIYAKDSIKLRFVCQIWSNFFCDNLECTICYHETVASQSTYAPICLVGTIHEKNIDLLCTVQPNITLMSQITEMV